MPGVSVIPAPVAIALLALLACSLIVWLALLAQAPRRPMPTVPLLAALPAAAVIAAALGFAPVAGTLFITILAGGVVWHAAILRFFDERGVRETIFGAFLASGALASIAAIVMAFTRTPIGLWVIQHGRATGTFVLPGELAGYLIVYIPLALALARIDARLRPLAVTGLACAAVAFVMTFSRAGWAGLAAALAMLFVLRGHERGKRSALSIIVGAAVVLAALFNAHHDPSENFTRLSIWEASLRMVARFPFSGVGPFAFPDFYPQVRVPGGEPVALHAHDIVLTIAAETGLAGVAALALGWWGFLFALRPRLALAPPDGTVVRAIAAGLFGTWVQGLVDTSSVVLVGLWLPMMALALAAGAPGAAAAARLRIPRVALVTFAVIALPCALIQVASSAVYAREATPASFPAHLPPALGRSWYGLAYRIAPLPFFDEMLAEDALRRVYLDEAAQDAARLADPTRSELEARIALARGDTRSAAQLFLRAGDDAAIDGDVRSLMRAGRYGEAEALERSLRDRLQQTATRPNALAESWWELGRIAERLGREGEAADDYAHASALAPLNTKYLIDAATLASRRHDDRTAAVLRARAHAIDPTK